MENNIKTNFKQITNALNSYVESKDLTHIQDIEVTLKKLFSAEYVRFWKYNKSNESLNLMDMSVEETVLLDSSLTKQTIDNRSTTVVNHITSEKYYVPKIDNPLELKVKSLMIFPICKGKEVRGILKIGRGLKQRKVFTKQDESVLEELSVLFLKLMMSESLDKDELITLTGEEIKRTTPVKPKATKPKVTKPSADKTSTKTVPKVTKPNVSKTNTKGQVTIEAEKSVPKKEYDALLEEQKALHKKLEKYQEKELTLKSEITEHQSTLKNVGKRYKDLEASSEELHGDIKEYQNVIKNFESEVKSLIKENNTLRNAKKAQQESQKSIQELKSEKSLHSSENMINIDQDIESILYAVDNMFSDNEYSYMLFELIIYALYSKKGLAQVEELVRKSKLLPEMIEEYYFNNEMKVHSNKHTLSKVIDSIEQYEKNIFKGQPKINADISKKTPVSLVFDRPKVQSIVFHLLNDLYQFVDHSKDIDINLRFDNKFLIIEIGGFTHSQNSLFKSMFKKTKLSDDDKDRLGLKLSRKLVKKLKGTIETTYQDEYYKFVLMLPVKVIKI